MSNWYDKYLSIYGRPFSEVPEAVIEETRQRLAALQSDTPLASIVVIAYNEETHLQACLWALSEIRCKYPVEIIGVDNDSRDRTAEIYQRSGIPYYTEHQHSCGYARRCGLQHARGKYYFDVDSDTLYPPQYYEVMLERLMKPGNGSFSAACALTVQAKVIPVTSVNVDNWSITMLAGETVSLKVTVLPEDATNKNITFQSENTEVAAVDSEGTILAIGAGSTKVIVTSEDGGLTSNCMVTVVSETGEMEVDGIFYRNYYMRSLEVIANPDENVKYSGNIKIPGKITYNGIEYTVDRVGDRAFLGCESLISVELAEGFRVIGPYGFAGCENLEKITLPASLESIDWANQVFAFCPKLEIVVSEKNPLFFINDGALYWKDPSYGIALRWLPEKKTGTFSIMEGTGAIRSYALFHTSIDKIIIPTSIVFIFERFFCGECKTPLEIVLNWSTASEINNIYKAYDDPSPFYFNTTDRSKITVSVPKGTKPFYSAHWLWGACGSIVER